MIEKRVQHVVVDAGGFIKDAPVAEIGANIYTLREVVDEIKDKATRQRLQVLPYEIKYVEPSPEIVRTVTDFSKKTGDYRSLSAVDIKLIALVLHLEKQHCGLDHVKTEPNSSSQWTTTQHNLQKPTEIAGFYLKKNEMGQSNATSRTTSFSVDVPSDAPETVLAHAYVSESLSNCSLDGVEQASANCVIADGSVLVEDVVIEEDESEEGAEESSSDGEDGGGWITPRNLAAARQQMGSADCASQAVVVGCLTLDFSMQNVLIQMGLSVVSIDGMLIKKARSYVQRCSACMKITTNMGKEFCPVCGNSTLRRLAMTVDSEGRVQYCFSKRRPPTTRGLRYSLPAPQGGKYAHNPVLCADQPQPQQRLSRKAKTKYNVFEAGYEANSSPFAPKDTQSRSVMLGFHNRRAGNDSKKRTGRKK